jgi:type IV secretory pathway VirB9-like protein
MTIIKKATATTTALVFTSLLGVSASFAQQPPSPNPAPAPGTRAEQPMPERPAAQDAKANTIKGELVRVDAATKMLVVKTALGAEEKIAYNDATKVTGAKDGVAGLANASNSNVTIKFTGTGADRVATEITVDKKS